MRNKSAAPSLAYSDLEDDTLSPLFLLDFSPEGGGGIHQEEVEMPAKTDMDQYFFVQIQNPAPDIFFVISSKYTNINPLLARNFS